MSNPFEKAIFDLMRGLGHVEAPRIDAVPEPEQIEAIATLITDVARLGDAFMRAVGEELRINAPMPLRLNNFQSPFTDAVDGYALFDVACVVQELRAEQDAEAW